MFLKLSFIAWCLVLSTQAQVVLGYGNVPMHSHLNVKSAAKRATSGSKLYDAFRDWVEHFSPGHGVVHEFLQRYGITASTPIRADHNIMHLLAYKHVADDSTSLAILEELMLEEETVDWETADEEGRTPLHYMAQNGKMQTVEFMLANGARADSRNIAGKLPSDYARENGHKELAKTLDMYAEASSAAEIARKERATDGVSTSEIADVIETVNIQADDVPATESTEVVDEDLPDFLDNLNQRARAGDIEPVIGRVEEIKRIVEVLRQRHNNNPVLVGPPGVGKTAIIEGLAHLIVKGEVPRPFLDKTIYAVSIGAMTAGTGLRGGLEEKVAELLAFAEQHPEAIFFIDELHHIESGDTGSNISIAEQLKPMLSAGKLPLIGATTDDEFRRHIAKDGALARRFVRINVGEPSEAEVVDILLGFRDRISVHQDIEIPDEAVLAAIEYAKYFTDKQLPFSAITLLDEAAASLGLRDGFYPMRINNLSSTINRLTASLPTMNGKGDEVREEIAQLQADYEQNLAAWQKQEADRQELAKIQADIVAVEEKINGLEHKDKFTEADELRHNKLQELFNQREQLTDSKILHKRHVAELVAAKLKVPVEKILLEEQEGVFDLLPQLQGDIIGQDDQLKDIVGLVAVNEAGLNLKPPPSFLLLGPSGVGKTETVIRLQSILDDGRRELIRLDMSEYMEGHTVSALLGAPAGYVGHEDGSRFITEIKAHPSAIILLDEIEKAHPNLHYQLLQMLDGRLTSRDNEEIDLSQTMIFMTSNSENPDEDFVSAVRGRINRTIYYNPLNLDIMSMLVHREVAKLNKSLHSKDIVVTLSDDMIATLAAQGYNEELGARPLQNLFSKSVTTPLSFMLMDGELTSGKYHLQFENDEVKVEQAE